MSKKITQAQIKLLTKPMAIHKKPGAGSRQFDYVKGSDVVNRLNEAFGFAWSFTVLEVISTEPLFIVVKVALEYNGITKHSFGGAPIAVKRGTTDPVDLGNSYKSATTNGLKKAAELFGIGLDNADEGDYDIDLAPASSMPKASPKAVKSSAAAHGTSTTATASTTITTKTLAPETTVKTSPVSAVAPSAVDAAKALLAGLTSGGASKAEVTPTPAPTNVESVPDNPFSSAAATEGKLSSIQKSTIEKLCESVSKTPLEVITLTASAGKLGSGPKPLVELNRKEAAVVIRFLSVME